MATHTTGRSRRWATGGSAAAMRLYEQETSGPGRRSRQRFAPGRNREPVKWPNIGTPTIRSVGATAPRNRTSTPSRAIEMCGRYKLTVPFREIVQLYNLRLALIRARSPCTILLLVVLVRLAGGRMAAGAAHDLLGCRASAEHHRVRPQVSQPVRDTRP